MVYIVPTPIGNLEDITLRALRILKEASIIVAEDTRVIKHLLKQYAIPYPEIISLHNANENTKVDFIIQKIKDVPVVAVVSDAGTPSISDPGYRIVNSCIESNIPFQTLPGATAFVPALVNSGLPTHSFQFDGFLPHKKGRETQIKSYQNINHTVVLYESTHRIIKTLQQFKVWLGDDRLISVSREISKMHEETVRGTVAEVLAYYEKNITKGEFVIILGAASS